MTAWRKAVPGEVLPAGTRVRDPWAEHEPFTAPFVVTESDLRVGGALEVEVRDA